MSLCRAEKKFDSWHGVIYEVVLFDSMNDV